MADNSEAFNNLKIEIRSILLPLQKGCSLFQFRKDYKQMLGRDIPYSNFNYRDDVHLLHSIPDTVRIFQSGGDYHLMAVANDSTQHIQKMVAKQKPAKSKPSKNRNASRCLTYTGRSANKPPFLRNSTPYTGKPASRASYTTPVVSRSPSSSSQSAWTAPSSSSQSAWTAPSSASQSVRPSYASQSALAGSNPFTKQPVRDMSKPLYASQTAPVVNKPVPIAKQPGSNKPGSYGSIPSTVANQTAALARKPAASNAAVGGWVGQRQSDIPPRFRAPVNTTILPPDVECRIVNLVRTFTTGLRMSDFPVAYQRHFKEMFSWDKHGFNSLKHCLDSIPDLAMSLVNNDFVIYYVDKSSTKPSSAQQSPVRQIPGKLVDFDSSTMPSPAFGKNKAVEVFQFSGSWNSGKDASLEPQKQEAWSFNQASAKPIFSFSADSYNLKNNSPLDEKSLYYQDSAAYKSSIEETPKKKADVLDTFELSSSLGVTDKIKNNMTKIMSKNKQGIFATEFPEIYENVTGSHFDLHSLGFNHLTELVDSLPDVFRRKRLEGSKKDWIIVPAVDEVADSCSSKKNALHIECSIQNISKILQGFPEGLQLTEFLNVYSANLKEPLNIIDLGFSCIEDFLLSISERVPLKIETVEGIKTIFLAETEEVCPPIEEIPTARVSNFPVYEEQESIPFDAASPDCQYHLLQLPADFDRSIFVPAYTCSIYHPGHLFVQLEGKETTEALNKLYDDIHEFYYGPYSYQYQMKRRHLKERAMCAALWPQKTQDRNTGDNMWYRALVIGHKHDSAKVFYVDYGTTDEVPLTMLRYLKEAFTKLPAQAIKARLAHLKPPNNAPCFSREKTQKRMLELCNDIKLMAKVEDEKDGVLSLILCDTNGETDVYINDILLQEGLAVCINDPPPSPPEQPLQYPPHLVIQAQCYWQMYNTLSLTMSPEEVSSQMQRLSLNYRDNPLVQKASMQLFQNIPPTISPPCTSNSPPSDESEIFQDDDDLFEEFYQKASSVSKRYVKRVRTSDGYFFHVLIVDGEAFVSSGDVSMLIWNDKSPQYLLERLQTRDIVIPSHCISQKGNDAMFHQFEKFHVKGTQNNGDFSSIIVYPLRSAIQILNIYGHPSVELRHKIMMEIESFNPQLPAWQEVSEVEMQDDEEDLVYRANTDDDKLKRLCIHDLMAMKEGIRQKRNTLVRKLECDKHNESTVDELDKLEGLMKRVVVRIEQIKQICATFS